MNHKELKRILENDQPFARHFSIDEAMELVEEFERLQADQPIPHCIISKLHPGDTIIFKYPGMLSDGAVSRLEKSIAAALGVDTHRVVILEEGSDIEIVRPENVKEGES